MASGCLLAFLVQIVFTLPAVAVAILVARAAERRAKQVLAEREQARRCQSSMPDSCDSGSTH